jgi:hypothetical protein
MMIKFCKALLTVLLALVCIAGISGSTLLLKSRFDQAVEAAVQARLNQRTPRLGLTFPDEFGGIQEPPGHQYVESDDDDPAAARRIVEDELRDVGPEEREIWIEELKHRSPHEIREILALRHRFAVPFGSLAEEGVQFTSSDREPPRVLPESSTADASPIPPDALARMAASIESLQAELNRLREELAAQQREPRGLSPRDPGGELSEDEKQ